MGWNETYKRLVQRRKLASIFANDEVSVDDILAHPFGSRLAAPGDEEPDEEPVEDEDGDEEIVEEMAASELPGDMDKFIAAIQQMAPGAERSDVIRYLLHTSRGQNVARHMANTFKREDIPMPVNREIELQSIVKQHGGLAAMAKLFVAEGRAVGNVSELEFYKLLSTEAEKQRQPGESSVTAFSRFYSDPANVELRKAHALTRGF
jgi:hypothetical protein